MSKLEIGAAAPDFTLPNHADQSVTLSSLRGQPVVIWFFSRAFGSN